MNSAFPKLIRTALIVLTLTGALKVVSGAGHAHILDVSDHLLGISFRKLFFIVGGTELCGGILCLLPQFERYGPPTLVFFSLSFLSYRAVSVLSGVNTFCPCLGRATDWWPWLGVHQQSVTFSIAIWLGVIGLGSMFADRLLNWVQTFSAKYA